MQDLETITILTMLGLQESYLNCSLVEISLSKLQRKHNFLGILGENYHSSHIYGTFFKSFTLSLVCYARS